MRLKQGLRNWLSFNSEAKLVRVNNTKSIWLEPVGLVKHVRRVVRKFALVGLLSPVILNAENKGLDFNQQIDMLKTAKSVTVTISNPARGNLYNYDWVKSHPKYGCTYSSQDPARIAQLLQAFKNTKVREIPINESFLPVVQSEIYFTLPNNTEAQLLFGREYINEQTIDGEYNLEGNLTETSILANRLLSEDLLNWVQQIAFEEKGAASKLLNNVDVERQNWLSVHSIMESCNRMLSTKFYRDYQIKNQTCDTNAFYQARPDICPSGWLP